LLCFNHIIYYKHIIINVKNNSFLKKLNFFARQIIWAINQSSWWRIIILGLFGYILFQNLNDPWFSIHQSYNPLVLFDFGIHELGHPIFSIFGTLIYIAGGCIFQCLFPILWFFASTMFWGWLGINIFSVAAYANDARARLLPLGG
jgi:hypothetical protein